jgi:8-oxoguanine deaminase
MATVGGAAVLNRPELGRIAVGRAADLVMYDALDVGLAGAYAQHPVAALMLCQAPRPSRVIVAGKTVVQDGRIVAVDMARHVADFNALVTRRFKPG